MALEENSTNANAATSPILNRTTILQDNQSSNDDSNRMKSVSGEQQELHRPRLHQFNLDHRLLMLRKNTLPDAILQSILQYQQQQQQQQQESTRLMQLEYSIHPCPRRFRRELLAVFPELLNIPTGTASSSSTASLNADLSSLFTDVHIIPTFQRCQWDLVATGPHVEAEKDEKLVNFYHWSALVCGRLREQGFWADMTDPASGYPVFGGRGSAVYPDVHGANRLLAYDIMNTGCCSVLLHPKWGSQVYPATMFARAPSTIIDEIIMEIGL